MASLTFRVMEVISDHLFPAATVRFKHQFFLYLYVVFEVSRPRPHAAVVPAGEAVLAGGGHRGPEHVHVAAVLDAQQAVLRRAR